ncbi:transmembrane protein 186-like isoform X2 [Pollicipes pollicipes]|uniref:transmembrane protein 186-like isoform X1 n=1 Tax=Pollicipes pollicipes TaxID=41117 RepID=UPI00188534BD|nr:transmembrane protein 186-like isoform X1 [Pollicipes pollicipes]XP_037093947.1 transmembrane protein 186-like isoform X2 [Pollicipes pollicipes]
MPPMFGLRSLVVCRRHLPQQRHLYSALWRHLHTVSPLRAPLEPAAAQQRSECSPPPPALSRHLHTCQPLSRRPRLADPDFEIIYRFPYIGAVRMLCRLKLYQTGLTLLATPATLLLVDGTAATQVGVVGVFTCVMLFVMGEFFRRFVGILYLKRDGQMLKVAHLTFWGGRHDQLIPISDVVPFSELHDSPRAVYFALCRYSSPQRFYMSLRYGGVTSREKLETVFGPIDDR